MYTKLKNNLIVFNPIGKMDINFSTEFEKILQQAIKDNPRCHVLINLKGVDYLSSSGLRAFITVREMLHEQGYELKVFNVNDACKRIFSLTKFEDLVGIYANEKEAIDSF